MIEVSEHVERLFSRCRRSGAGRGGGGGGWRRRGKISFRRETTSRVSARPRAACDSYSTRREKEKEGNEPGAAFTLPRFAVGATFFHSRREIELQSRPGWNFLLETGLGETATTKIRTG